MPKKLPAIQFYPGDWLKDPGVRALEYHERGIWIELLCLMHESEVPGKLLLGGRPYPEDRLARLLGLSHEVMSEVISLLITLNVASRCPETGALMNRRMVRDRELSLTRGKNGKKGGNPAFVKGQPNPYYAEKDKQKDNQNNQVRLSSNITPSSSSSISTSISKKELPIGSSKETRSKKGTRIPDDFEVTPAMAAWAKQECPGVSYTEETKRFVRYWRTKTGRDATKLDWVMTWENWMLLARDKYGGNGNGYKRDTVGRGPAADTVGKGEVKCNTCNDVGEIWDGKRAVKCPHC